MAFTPPASPVTNQIYSDGVGKNWQWDGTQWQPYNPPLGFSAITGASAINAGSASSTYNGPLVVSSVATAIPKINNVSIVGNSSLSTALTQTFTSSSVWTKPTNFPGTAMVLIQAQAGGGSGGSGLTVGGCCGGDYYGSGGGGGAYIYKWVSLSSLPSSVDVTVGAGGASVTSAQGNFGGDTKFGTILTAYGGGRGSLSIGNGTGGAGGGLLPNNQPLQTQEGFGGTGVVGGASNYKGGGGGGTITGLSNGQAGGASVWGGGGGGSYTSTGNLGLGGNSVNAGIGGNGGFALSLAATSGQFPSGGGGGAGINLPSGAGGNGQIIITIFNGV